MKKFRYSLAEEKLLRSLNTPAKIQDYLNLLPFNFEERWGTCMSPRRVIREKTADCVEGALLAAAALEFHGKKPLVIDLRTIKEPYDYDHVIAVYEVGGFWGCVSKTNHPILRYRDPVYRDVRELAMSFFNEYFLKNGLKTLREYSDPFDLNFFNDINWRTSESELSEILEKLDTIPHHKILSKKQEKNLRKADKIERKFTDYVEYRKKK